VLNFDEELFLAKQRSIVALRPKIERFAAQAIENGISNVYLIGAGGTYANALPYEAFAKERSDFPVRTVIGTELMLTDAHDFGPNTLAVFSTVSGTTEDIVASIAWAKSRGATTLAFTGIEDSPIARDVDYVVLSAPRAWPFDVQYLVLIGSILHARGEWAAYPDFAASLDALPEALLDVAKSFDATASEFAEAHATDDYYFLVGAGNLWGFTYLYSMCVLEEMQWLRTTRVHGSEFFHGSLELLERDTTVLLFQSEDSTRPLMDRVAAFAPRVSDDVTIIDAKTFALPGIAAELRGLFSPIVLDVASDRLSQHLSRVRDHSLDLRRYYRVMDY
jgi:fructoselysine-6-phosphate deglycase